MTLIEYGQIVSLDKVCRGRDYQAVREAFAEEMRREVRAYINMAGMMPPLTVPVEWVRVPPLVDLGYDPVRPEWSEEPVTDATVIEAEDWLLARVAGVLEQDEAGATVLTPVPDDAEPARVGKHHLHKPDDDVPPPATVTKGFVYVETPEPAPVPEWPPG